MFNSFVVADPHNVDAPPALTVLCGAEPDPAFHFDANPDLAFLCSSGSGFKIDSVPDPASQNTIHIPVNFKLVFCWRLEGQRRK
jgi:hypothetical protein